MVQVLIGLVVFALGIGLLIYCVRESKKGYTSVYGNDIGALYRFDYANSIWCIINL